METLSATLDWLLTGDPAVRWQTMRDLLNEPPTVWQAERQRTLTEGWGSRLLACQNPDGGWGQGPYSPKWTSTTYTLLTLENLGLPSECTAARRGTQLLLRQMLGEPNDTDFHVRLARCDRCIVGMLLLLACTYGGDAQTIDALLENLLAERMPDGAWNCRKDRPPAPWHSSFHTTINVLEGLQAALERREDPTVRAALQGGMEVLLQHNLFRSDRRGVTIRDEFVELSYPYRWHYQVLRALTLFVRATLGAARDPRLREAVELVRELRGPDGHWHNQRKFSGLVFFNLETGREGSRILTLQALRVLRWWAPEAFQDIL